MQVLVLSDPYWSPFTTDVLLIPEGKTPEETYVNFIRKLASDKTNIDYDEEYEKKINSLTDDEIVDDSEESWDVSDLIEW